jgi:hypothetical protein
MIIETLNTFDALEHNVLEAFSSINNLPPVYSISPINILLINVTDEELNYWFQPLER